MLMPIRTHLGLLTSSGSLKCFGTKGAVGLPVIYSLPESRNVTDDIWNATTGERIGGGVNVTANITPIESSHLVTDFARWGNP